MSELFGATFGKFIMFGFVLYFGMQMSIYALAFILSNIAPLLLLVAVLLLVMFVARRRSGYAAGGAWEQGLF